MNKKYFKFLSFSIMVWVILFCGSFIFDLYSITGSGNKVTFMGLGISVTKTDSSLTTIFGLAPNFLPALFITISVVFTLCVVIDYIVNKQKDNDN